MEENIRLLFASNLKSLLAKNEKTQADMVKYMKISSATASDWCNGKKIPRTDKLQSLCAWLDCELGDLIGERTAASNQLDEDRARLLECYDSFNQMGKAALLEYANYLNSQGKYKRGSSDSFPA